MNLENYPIWYCPKTQSEPIKNWEQFVMNFCLDVNEAFKTWSGDMELKFKIYTKKALTISKDNYQEIKQA